MTMYTSSFNTYYNTRSQTTLLDCLKREKDNQTVSMWTTTDMRLFIISNHIHLECVIIKAAHIGVCDLNGKGSYFYIWSTCMVTFFIYYFFIYYYLFTSKHWPCRGSLAVALAITLIVFRRINKSDNTFHNSTPPQSLRTDPFK